MAQNRSQQPGPAWKPSSIFARRALYKRSGPRSIRVRLAQMLSRTSAPSVALGVTVGASLLVIETLVVCFLNDATATIGHFATFYLVGVVVVSTVWGFGLSVTMSVASAVAFTYFRNWPTAHFAPLDPQNAMVFAVFLIVALLANTLAGLAQTGERLSTCHPTSCASRGRTRSSGLIGPVSVHSGIPPGSCYRARFSILSFPRTVITYAWRCKKPPTAMRPCGARIG